MRSPMTSVRDLGLILAVAGRVAVSHEKEHDGVGGIGHDIQVPGSGVRTVAVVESLPYLVYPTAQGQYLVPELPEISKRVPLGGRLLPRGGGNGKEGVAQPAVGHLTARGGAELDVVGEDERLRDAEGQEISGLRARASL